MPDGGKAGRGDSECVKRGEGRGGRGNQCYTIARDAPLGSDLGTDTWCFGLEECSIAGLGNNIKLLPFS